MALNLTRRALMLVGLLALLAACQSASSEAPSIRLGYKRFTEQAILRDLYRLLLEQGGFTVDISQGDLQETAILHSALLSGTIDLYPEYTGTALRVVLDQPKDNDAERVAATVASMYQSRFRLVWLQRAPLNNTWAIAMSPALAGKYGITTISDFVAHASQFSLAESTLQAPLRRRSLVLQRKLLAQHGRLELHNAIMEILGWSRFRWHDVEWYAGRCATAFDYAARMFKSPTSFQQHRRPYVVAGAQEMIEQGYCQEAMFWISRSLWMANATIQQHAPAANRPFFQATIDRLMGTMGLHGRDDIARRVSAIEALIPSVVALSEGLIDQYCQAETALWG